MCCNEDSRWPVHLAHVLGLFLACLVLTASFFPEKRLWGINHLAFYPMEIRFFAWTVIFASFLPVVGQFICRICERTAFLAHKKQLTAAIIMAAGGFLLFTGFDSSTLLLGDGQYIANNIENALAADSHTYFGYLMQPDRFYPGTEVLHLSVSRIASSVFGISPLTGVKIFIGFFGALLVFLLVSGLLERPSASRQKSAILALIVLFSGSIQIFFGYIEMYAPLLLFSFLYFILARRVITSGAKLWGPAACVFIAMLMHVLGLILVPSLFFLIIWAVCRRRFSRKLLAGSIGLFAAMIAVQVTVPRIESFTHYFLPLTGSRGGYGILSAAHLIDIANELFLLFPGIMALGALAIGIAAYKIRRCKPNGAWVFSQEMAASDFLAELLFCVMLFVPATLLLFTVTPELGMARDWDLFAVSLVGVCAPIVFVIDRFGKDAIKHGTLRLAVTPIFVTTLVLTIAWVGINADPARSIARFESILAYDKTNAGYAYENLASYYKNVGDVDSEIRALELAYHSSRNPRYLHTLGSRYYYIGKKDEAVKTLQKALELAPGNERVRWSLVQMLYFTKRYDEVLEVCTDGVNLAPKNPFYPFFMGKTYANQGRIAEAREAFEKCRTLNPTAAMIEEINNFLESVEQQRNTD